MNERIRELAEQAGIVPGIMGLNRFTYFDPEKFAELIVKECARIASASPYPYNDIELILDGRQTWDLARSEAGHEIQKYFGDGS